MRWPLQTGWLSWSGEGLPCPSSSSSSLARMNCGGPDHVFCPSSGRMVMSVATAVATAPSTKHKAGLGGGDRRGPHSISLPPSAFYLVAETLTAERRYLVMMAACI